MTMQRRASPGNVLFLLAPLLCAMVAAGADDGQVLDGPNRAVASVSVARCPFSFQQGMPPGVFCVYDGIAMESHGDVCEERVPVMWTRMLPEFSTGDGLDGELADDVYFGVLSSPDVVLRAIPDPGADSRAVIVDYTQGNDQPRVPLRGDAVRQLVPAAGGEGAEVLRLHIARPVFAPGNCAFTTYDGVFAGVLSLPPHATR